MPKHITKNFDKPLNEDKVAFYAGSFDPITKGHFNIICQALASFSKVYVGIGDNPEKKCMLSPTERLECIQNVIQEFITEGKKNPETLTKTQQVALKKLNQTPEAIVPLIYEGLTIDAAIKVGATTLVRGVRNDKDKAYEKELKQINSLLLKVRGVALEQKILKPENQSKFNHISSSLVKSFCAIGEYDTVKEAVSPFVYKMLLKESLFPLFTKLIKEYGCYKSMLEIRWDYDRVRKGLNQSNGWEKLGSLFNCLNMYVNQNSPFATYEQKKDIEHVQLALFYRVSKDDVTYHVNGFSKKLLSLIQTDFSKKQEKDLSFSEKVLFFVEQKARSLTDNQKALVCHNQKKSSLSKLQLTKQGMQNSRAD